MRTIKTRNTVKKGIKVLDKPANLSKRMKNNFIRTKEKAEETQSPRHASSTDYASANVQDTARNAAKSAVHHLPNPRHKALKNFDRAKGHFQEVKRNLPKECQRVSEQARQTAVKTKNNSEALKKTADNAQKTANEANTAVRDAKQTLKKVRLEGRHSLREVRQKAKSKIIAKQKNTPSVKSGKPVNNPTSAHSGSVSRPSYLSKGVSTPQGAGNTIKTSAKSSSKAIKSTTKGTIKTAKKSVKTAEKSAKSAVKTAQQAAKTAQKSAQAAAKSAKIAAHTARVAAKAAAKTAIVTKKVVIATVKAAIAAVKGLIALIAAGGWVAVLVVVIICMIAMLVGSVFGIFFSSEPDTGSGLTVNGVISEINMEFTGQIDAIISANPHDLLDMSGSRAGWRQVLAVYSVRTVSDPDNPMEVATMDEEKAAILRTVFWDMNTISYTLDTVCVEEDVLGDDGLPIGETEITTKTVLRIVVSHRTPDEMAVQYGFDAEQIEWLEELLKPEYISLWNALFFGVTSIGDGTMIGIAEAQIGNIGGEIYWRWYGFNSRVPWCAIFVSWVADQAGLLDAGIIPRFASVNYGIQWFRDRGQWQGRDYTPAPGDLIFFDWNGNGRGDHVGIVERVEGGYVYAIEGNTSDSVARRRYRLDSVRILGYGVPAY